MAGFTRRYLQDPGLEELLTIEGVVIIDREPAGSITGVGAGTVCVVGETEDGPFNTPTEVFSGGDLVQQFGGLGSVIGGIAANNPCARSRLADGAIVPEYWNGNLFVAVANKKFRRLVVVRADTTVGAVEFTRLAYLNGNSDATWALTAGAVLAVSVDGTPDTATFAAAVAAEDSASGSYPTGFTGGETLVLVTDQGTTREVSVTVTFTAADQSHVQCVARINAALGYTGASVQAADVTRIVGRVAGTGGSVVIVSRSATVGSKIGLSVGTTAGTGDVADISSVTFAEAKAVIEGDCAGTLVERDEAGRIRLVSLETTTTPSIEVTSATTTALAFGFPLDVEATPATVAVDGVIPAGVVVQDGSGNQWVTARTTEVLAASTDPISVRVRPAVDDGTTVGAVPAAVDEMPNPIPGLGTWAVSNPLGLSAALSEAQIDAAYATAIDSTRNPNSVAKEVNVIVSARASNAVRNRIRANVLEASASGRQGRVGVIRPPLGTTTRAWARGSAQPGVGAYRDQRVLYAFPGGRTFVSAIAARGTSGGAGFTTDGNLDVGSDTWLASVISQLPPEENPGQLTTFAAGLLGLEAGNPDVQAMTIDDYTAFRAAGICALRMDEGTAIFQSGVTSVNPVAFPNLKNIARRRMADLIADSIAVRLRPFAKRLATRERRATIVGEIEAYMNGLKSGSRIDDYLVDAIGGNTPESLAAGVFRIIIKARTLPSLDVIVLDVEAGENVVTVLEAA
jgi:hypothetical protein